MRSIFIFVNIVNYYTLSRLNILNCMVFYARIQVLNNKYKGEVLIVSKVLEHYNFLHNIPELGMNEVKTAAYLAQQIKEYGYNVETDINGKTGVVGVIDSGKPGPTLALRGDMDALGHVIDGQQCARHTCGHDGHSAMVLAAAQEVVQKGLLKRGKLKILFQPAEELASGALSLIRGGAIDDVDIVIGAHIQTAANVPTGTITPAMYHAAQNMVVVKFHGVQAHGSRPHLGVNAIEAANMAINAVNAIHIDPNLSYSIKPTRFICDSGAANSIPAEAVVTWDARAQFNSTMAELLKKAELAITNSAAAVGATVEIDMSLGVPAAEYTADAIEIIKKAIIKTVGESGLYKSIDLTGGEDFHNFIIAKPTISAGYFGIGCNALPGLHHPDMKFETSYLETGKDVFVNIVMDVLG
mgnify:CR=1 FL=1